MDPETVVQSEVSQREKNKDRTSTHRSGVEINGRDDLTSKTDTETQTQRTNMWMPRGETGAGDELGDWD